MDVNTTNETLCVSKIIGQKSDVIFVEGDIIVPDVKPDILNAINVSGNVCVYKKEILDGKVRIDGNVNVYIMYLADTENQNIRGLNSSIDFTEILDIDGCNSSMILDEDISIKSIECKILNGRKVNVKVSLSIDANVYTNENLEFISNLDLDQDIQCLKSPLEVNSIIGEGNTKTIAKDTVIIDNADTIAEILSMSLNIVNKDAKISYNKILAKAEACVKIMYLTEDGRICTQETMIPIMGFIDMPNVTEDNLPEIKYKLKNIIINPNPEDEHSIYIEAEFEIMCKVYETKQIQIIEDLYSTCKEVNFDQRNVVVLTDKTTSRQTCNIRERAVIQEIGENKIYDTIVKVNINKEDVIQDNIIYDGDVEINFVFQSNDLAGLDTVQYKLPFSFTAALNGVNLNSSISTEIELGMQDFVVLSDGIIDIKIDLLFNINASKQKNIKVIDNITMDDLKQDNLYSMTIYFVKKSDTLWNIAKKHKSTIDEIVRVNNIEDENKIYPGQQLFIPKHRLTKNVATA